MLKWYAEYGLVSKIIGLRLQAEEVYCPTDELFASVHWIVLNVRACVFSVWRNTAL